MAALRVSARIWTYEAVAALGGRSTADRLVVPRQPPHHQVRRPSLLFWRVGTNHRVERARHRGRQANVPVRPRLGLRRGHNCRSARSSRARCELCGFPVPRSQRLSSAVAAVGSRSPNRRDTWSWRTGSRGKSRSRWFGPRALQVLRRQAVARGPFRRDRCRGGRPRGLHDRGRALAHSR